MSSWLVQALYKVNVKVMEAVIRQTERKNLYLWVCDTCGYERRVADNELPQIEPAPTCPMGCEEEQE